jgi:hypothetical protein
MSYTVLKLISNAYYLAGIVSREFQAVSGTQHADGLDLLNDVLAEKTVDQGMIPYVTKYNLSTVVGQENYEVPDLISINTLTFVKDDVRYAMNKMFRRKYFGSNRANNVQSLPYHYHFERHGPQNGGLIAPGGTLSLYFLPDSVYEMEIWGLFRLASVTLNQDLELTLDRFYISYLRYALARILCVEFNYSVPEELQRKLDEMQLQIDKSSAPLDLTLQKLSSLDPEAQTINYAIANFGGWTV